MSEIIEHIVLLIAVMAVEESLFHKEGITAITALGVLIIYFGILSLFKNKLNNAFKIEMEPYHETINLITF